MSARLAAKGAFHDPTLATSLKGFFQKRQGIFLVFLFGSAAAKRMGPLSDVDVGVLFEAIPDAEGLGALAGQLTDLVRREVDLVVLNRASPVLKMQVLKKGILIYAKDTRSFPQFFTDTVNQYDDLKQIRKNCEKNVLKGRIYAG